MSRRRWLILALCALTALSAALVAGALLLRRAAPYPARGVHTIRADDTALSLAHQAGFTWVVQLLEWREIEPQPEEYFWEYPDFLVRACEHYGLRLALRLDHPPDWALSSAAEGPPVDVEAYAAIVGRVAARYRGRVHAYILWNEPNLAAEWGGRSPDPAAYAALLRAAHAAVKAADPEALVVSAGLAPTNEVNEQALDDRLYLRGLYAAGARDYFDVLGAHPYGFAYPPDDPPGAHEGLNFARLQELRQIMVENGDGEKPVWATELGWTIESVEPAQTWLRVSEEEQAAYLVGAFEKARREWPWLKLIAVWNLSAGLPKDDEKRGYSIVDDEYRPRLAYTALAALPKGRPRTARRPSRQAVEILAPDVAVRLGDVDTFYPHWTRIHGGHAPCRQWTGQFYVDDPGTAPWLLTMEIMQVEEQGNLVRINGHLLDPPAIPLRARPDFTSNWTVAEMTVPPGVLREGVNTLEVHLSPRLPVHQVSHVRFESLQFRNLRLMPLTPP